MKETKKITKKNMQHTNKQKIHVQKRTGNIQINKKSMYKRHQQASVKSFMHVKKVCSTKFRCSVLPKDKKKLQVNHFNK